MEVEEAKKQMKRFINEFREGYLDEGYMYDGIRWDCDEIAKTNIMDANILGILAGTLPDGFEWRDYYNVNHVVTLQYMAGLAAAICALYRQIYMASWQHKAAIDALNDVDAILNYDYTHTLWPQN